MNYNKKLILENGKEYLGYGFGYDGETISEIVFNTSMVGYQEIISDLSYCSQAVVMTYPLIGNYGLTDEDYETIKPNMGGIIVREYNDKPSNFRYTKTLSDALEENKIPGISGVDTREITRIIRKEGSMKVMITDIDKDYESSLLRLREKELGNNQVAEVSSKKVWYSRTQNPKYSVVAVDCGIKYNIIRKLNEKGCNVVIVPYNTSVDEIMKYKPDGVFLSNGPGNPEDVKEVLHLVSKLQGKIPMFGICLGHQLISLSNGAKTYKLKFGHRGGNHPVKNLNNNKLEITSQNHSYAVDEDSIKDTKLEVTHINVLDNTIEGLKIESDYIFSVQYHPESAPGPQDSDYLFDEFMSLMEKYWGNK